MRDESARRLTVRLEGGPADEGRLPLSELLRVGRQVQALVRGVATVLVHRPSGRPGRAKGFIEKSTDLQVVTPPRRGSFVLELELPAEPPALDQELEGMDLEPGLGERALEQLVGGLASLDEDADTLPSGFDRNLLRTAEQLRPAFAKGVASVVLERHAPFAERAIVDPPRLAIVHRLITEPVKGPAVADGRLEMVDRARLVCRIDRPERPGIQCRFPEPLRDRVAAAIGQHVRVSGQGRFQPNADDPDEIEVESFDIVSVQETLDLDFGEFTRERSLGELAEEQAVSSSDALLAGNRLSWMDDEEAAAFLQAAKGGD